MDSNRHQIDDRSGVRIAIDWKELGCVHLSGRSALGAFIRAGPVTSERYGARHAQQQGYTAYLYLWQNSLLLRMSTIYDI